MNMLTLAITQFPMRKACPCPLTRAPKPQASTSPPP